MHRHTCFNHIKTGAQLNKVQEIAEVIQKDPMVKCTEESSNKLILLVVQYQLILLHKLFSNLYETSLNEQLCARFFNLKFRKKKMVSAWKRGSEEAPLNIWSRTFYQYFRYLKKKENICISPRSCQKQKICCRITRKSKKQPTVSFTLHHGCVGLICAKISVACRNEKCFQGITKQ